MCLRDAVTEPGMDILETRVLVDVGGWLGAVLVLVAYLLVSMGKTSGLSFRYQAANFLGSILVGVNALYYWALPSFSINVVWMGIALAAMVKVRSRSSEAGR